MTIEYSVRYQKYTLREKVEKNIRRSCYQNIEESINGTLKAYSRKIRYIGSILLVRTYTIKSRFQN